MSKEVKRTGTGKEENPLDSKLVNKGQERTDKSGIKPGNIERDSIAGKPADGSSGSSQNPMPLNGEDTLGIP